MPRICAGIVLYNPDPERLKRNVAAARSQAEEVFLCDNGSGNIGELRALAAPGVTLLENGENLGIAAALNRLCREALAKGYDWILTLDHDTVVPEDMIRKMAPYLDAEDTAILCPGVWYEGWRERPAEKDTAEEVTACMTSGSLTRLSAWEKAGGFREEFFIDFVDNEFCKKLRDRGYKVIRVNGCVMAHSLGEVRTVKLPLLGERKWSVHAPWRFYYMVRNNIVFIRENRKDLNMPKEWAKVMYIACTGWLHTKQKRETLKYIRRGRRDAKKGVLGKMKA